MKSQTVLFCGNKCTSMSISVSVSISINVPEHLAVGTANVPELCWEFLC